MKEKELTIRDNLSILNMGQIFADSGYFKDARDAAQAVVKILAGKELGLPPIASMTGIDIIKGKISLSAVAMATVLKRHGSYDYRVKEHTEEGCEIEFFQSDVSLGLSRFTVEDAKQAGLLGKDNYQKYPRNMMFARAMSNGIRWFCPDVLGGPAYTPGELEAEVDNGSDEGEWIVEAEVDEFANWLEKEIEAKAYLKAHIEDGVMPNKKGLEKEFHPRKFSIKEVSRLLKEIENE